MIEFNLELDKHLPLKPKQSHQLHKFEARNTVAR